jgi:hypothetical protein
MKETGIAIITGAGGLVGVESVNFFAQHFDSLQELNKAILEQLAIHHNRKFRKSDHTRKEIFITQEQGALRPLPADFMLIKQSVSAKVQKNYHVVLGQDWHYYSVPHQYVGQQTTITYTSKHVEVYCDNKRIAVHQRNTRSYGFSTHAETYARKP